MGPVMEVIRYDNLPEALKPLFDKELVDGINCFHIKDLAALQSLKNQELIIDYLRDIYQVV